MTRSQEFKHLPLGRRQRHLRLDLPQHHLRLGPTPLRLGLRQHHP